MMKNISRDKICVILGFCYNKNLSFNNVTVLTEQCLMHKKRTIWCKPEAGCINVK